MLSKESVERINKAMDLIAECDEVVDELDTAYKALSRLLDYNEYLERLENNK